MPELQLTIGSDPEFCLFDRNTNRITSALNYLPNGKEEKLDLGDSFTFYSDNVLAELSMPCGNTTEDTVNNFTQLVRKTSEVLEKYNVRLVAQAAHEFTEEELNHPVAKTAGCSQEFDAIDVGIVEPPDLSTIRLRSAGAHAHIGRQDWKTVDDDAFLIQPWSKIAAIRAMDRYVGTALTYLEKDPTAMARKRLYGKAGRHRTPPYGVEYRSPSPYWTSRPELVAFVDSLTRFSTNKCQEDCEKYLNKTYDSREVVEIINTGDAKSAESFIEKHLPASFVKEAKSLNRLKYHPFLDDNYKV